MRSDACESLRVMLRDFDAQLQKGDNPGAWTYVVMGDVPELFLSRRAMGAGVGYGRRRTARDDVSVFMLATSSTSAAMQPLRP